MLIQSSKKAMKQHCQILSALQRAAKSGHLSAQFVLGRIYDEGWGVKQDARLAMKWYASAAAGGLREAYYFVGSGYSLGDGVTQSTTEALKWFHRGAKSGDLDAAYMEAVKVLEINDKSGMRLMLKAARSGSHDAMDYLADRYLKSGRFHEARKWAHDAVTHGDQLAHLRLRKIDESIKTTMRRGRRPLRSALKRRVRTTPA